MSNENVIWLASYPKSGNTWIKTILQEMLAPGVSPTIAIPSLIKEYPDDAPVYEVLGTRAQIVKTHCHTGHKRLRRNAGETAGVITIYRHPLDVLLSYINFSHVKKSSGNFKDGIIKSVNDIIAENEIDYYIDEFIELGGCREYLKSSSSWAEYYDGWSNMAPGLPHLLIRYEDMVANPVDGIEKIQSFLKIPPIDAAELMSEVEQRTSVDGKFFWRKKAYNFRDLLSPTSIARFERHFAGALERLGYGPESRAQAVGAEPNVTASA